MYRDTEGKFEIYIQISMGITISQEMLRQTVNKNIHICVGVSQVSQLVVMISLINDCYVMSLVAIISHMNFMLYRKNQCYVQVFKLKVLCALFILVCPIFPLWMRVIILIPTFQTVFSCVWSICN